MFSHIVIGSNDIERSKRFYDAVLATVGVAPGHAFQAPSGHNRVFYRNESGTFGVTEAINGEPATHANGGTIGFKCDSDEQVEAFHAAALQAGGTSCEDPPGLRQGAMGPMYLAYVRDPDGNKLCAIHRIKQGG